MPPNHEPGPGALACNLAQNDIDLLARGARPYDNLSAQLRPMLQALESGSLPSLLKARPLAAKAWARRGNKRISIIYPREDLARLDALMSLGEFKSRNEIVRCSIWASGIDSSSMVAGNGKIQKTHIELYGCDEEAVASLAQAGGCSRSRVVNDLMTEAAAEGPAAARHASEPAPRAWLGVYAENKPYPSSFLLDGGLVAVMDDIVAVGQLNSRSQLLRGLIRRAANIAAPVVVAPVIDHPAFRLPPLRGPEAELVEVGETTRTLMQWHRKFTGCQRPMSLHRLCIEVGFLAFPGNSTPVMPGRLKPVGDSAIDGQAPANHLNDATDITEALAEAAGEALLRDAKRLDKLLGVSGCTPELWKHLPARGTS